MCQLFEYHLGPLKSYSGSPPKHLPGSASWCVSRALGGEPQLSLHPYVREH